jgi:hypothetical protein
VTRRIARGAAHSTHHIFVQVSPSSLCSAAERQYLQLHEAEDSVRGSTRSRSMALPVAALAQAAAVGRAACAHAERRVATELAAARAMRRLKGEKLEIQGFESSARGLQARSHRRCLSAGNEIPLLKSSSNLRANEWGAARRAGGRRPGAAQHLAAGYVFGHAEYFIFLRADEPTAAAQELLVLVAIPLCVKAAAVAIPAGAVRSRGKGGAHAAEGSSLRYSAHITRGKVGRGGEHASSRALKWVLRWVCRL